MPRKGSIPKHVEKAIQEAIVIAEDKWPGADKYNPVWYSGEILIEVWKKGRADVYPILKVSN